MKALVDTEIPFTTFRGFLKCHRRELVDRIGAAAIAAAFPRFIERTEMSDAEVAHFAEMARQTAEGTAAYTHFAWSGRPNRRFAGDSEIEHSLPRERYYTVCVDEAGNDGQTLANEMMAYREPETSGECYALDLSDPHVTGLPAQRAVAVIFCSRPHLYNPFLRTLAELTGRPLTSFLSENVSVVVPYSVEYRTIERVIDLRLPHVRAWLARTFAQGDRRVLHKVLLTDRAEEVTFERMLPTLITPERGGGRITHAIGTWMRLHEVAALIFPSARSNVFARVRGGQLDPDGFWGWNLLDYRGAAPPEPKEYLNFSDWEQVGLITGIASAPPGDEYEGSLRVDGVLEASQSAHDNAVERFYASRSFMLHPMGMDIPASLEFISAKLASGAIAPTTGVSTSDEHLPSLSYASVRNLFEFPS